MAEPIIFIDGLRVEKPHEKAPIFVMGKMSIKAENLVAFIEKYKDPQGWLNIDILESKGGKWYAKLNTYGRKDLEGKMPEQQQPQYQGQDGPPMEVIDQQEPH